MSYIDIQFKLTPEIEEQVRQEVTNAFNEHILNNSAEFKKLVQSCILGTIRGRINEILQDKEYRRFMTVKIEEQLGIPKERYRSYNNDSCKLF